MIGSLGNKILKGGGGDFPNLPLMFPKIPQSSLGILTVPLPLNTPLRTLQLGTDILDKKTMESLMLYVSVILRVDDNDLGCVFPNRWKISTSLVKQSRMIDRLRKPKRNSRPCWKTLKAPCRCLSLGAPKKTSHIHPIRSTPLRFPPFCSPKFPLSVRGCPWYSYLVAGL